MLYRKCFVFSVAPVFPSLRLEAQCVPFALIPTNLYFLPRKWDVGFPPVESQVDRSSILSFGLSVRSHARYMFFNTAK